MKVNPFQLKTLKREKLTQIQLMFGKAYHPSQHHIQTIKNVAGKGKMVTSYKCTEMTLEDTTVSRTHKFKR